MRVPLSWLAEFVAIDGPVGTLVDRLVMGGLKVESIEEVGRVDPLVRVGRVAFLRPGLSGPFLPPVQPFGFTVLIISLIWASVSSLPCACFACAFTIAISSFSSWLRAMKPHSGGQEIDLSTGCLF